MGLGRECGSPQNDDRAGGRPPSSRQRRSLRWAPRNSTRAFLSRARVATLSTGPNSRTEFSTAAGLDSTHAHRFGRCYRDSELSLGLCSPKLIRVSNTLPIAPVSRVQVDAVEKAALDGVAMGTVHQLILRQGVEHARQSASGDKNERLCVDAAYEVMSDEKVQIGIAHAG